MVHNGMINQLQPLDISVNKPFKDYLKKEHWTWLLSENLPLTLSPQMVRSRGHLLQTCRIGHGRLEEIGGRTMEQSFKRCCSINALGCTEVDML
jgi:hypothetical protein